jgi:hypothetical protein
MSEGSTKDSQTDPNLDMPDFAAFRAIIKNFHQQQNRDLYPGPPAGPTHFRWPRLSHGHFLSIERRPADCSWSTDLVHACCTAVPVRMFYDTNGILLAPEKMDLHWTLGSYSMVCTGHCHCGLNAGLQRTPALYT